MWIVCEGAETILNTNNIEDIYVGGDNTIWVETVLKNQFKYRCCESSEEAQAELLNLFSMLNKKCS